MSDTTSLSQPASTKPAAQALPPGMVLGPDGKPCKICTAFRHMKLPTDPSKARKRSQAQGAAQNTTASVMAALASGKSSTPATASDVFVRPENCPPDVEQLGRATWTFLHTTAAYYPEKPTPNQRANMLSLLRALPILYPCSHCASHLGEEMKVNPPNVSGRMRLSQWLCETHNEVNERLGKKKFDCSIEKLDERWSTGPSDGSCD